VEEKVKYVKPEIFLLLLTAAFLGTALFAVYGKANAANGTYCVETQREATEPVIPQIEPIDLNSATKEELMTLDGIGEVLAGRIIDWRAENGPFQSVNDLLEVKGIGEKTLVNIQDFIQAEETE